MYGRLEVACNVTLKCPRLPLFTPKIMPLPENYRDALDRLWFFSHGTLASENLLPCQGRAWPSDGACGKGNEVDVPMAGNCMSWKFKTEGWRCSGTQSKCIAEFSELFQSPVGL